MDLDFRYEEDDRVRREELHKKLDRFRPDKQYVDPIKYIDVELLKFKQQIGAMKVNHERLKEQVDALTKAVENINKKETK